MACFPLLALALSEAFDPDFLTSDLLDFDWLLPLETLLALATLVSVPLSFLALDLLAFAIVVIFIS